MSIGPLFQHETCYDTAGPVGKSISRGDRTPEFKEFGEARVIRLSYSPVPGLPLEDAIRRRESVRSYAPKPLTVEQLSHLLMAANGLTHSDTRLVHRSIPSAGGLNPLEIYAVVSSVAGLDSGLYHFNVRDTSLQLVKSGRFAAELQAAAFGQEPVGNAPLALVITARFERTTQKYFDRGYRYVYMEVGAALQNVYLQAASLGLGTVAIGAFVDSPVNELLGVDGTTEAALLILPIGYPAE